MRKSDKSAGRPEPHNVICAVVLAAFLFALLIGIGVITGNRVEAATGSSVTIYVDARGAVSNEKIDGAVLGFFYLEHIGWVNEDGTIEFSEEFQEYLDYDYPLDPSAWEPDFTITTSADDDFTKVEVTSIEPGTYVALLYEVPEGYKITDSIDYRHHFASSGYLCYGTPRIFDFTDDTSVTIGIVVQEINYLSITKTDADTGEPLSGAVFTVYSAYGSGGDLGVEIYTEDEVRTVTTGADGTAILETYIEEYYYIVETQAPDGYAATEEAIAVRVGERAAGKTTEVSVTNSKDSKYTMSVSKHVAGDMDGSAADVEFEFSLYINGSAADGCTYQIMENGVLEEAVYTTGNGGTFILKDGQTAFFYNCFLDGEEFAVYETDDCGYTGVYPLDGNALTGIFEGNDVQLTFINSDKESLLVTKNYMSDGSDAAEAYLSSAQTDAEVRKNLEVTLTMEISDDGETYTSWPASGIEVEVVDSLTGEIFVETWTMDGMTIEPWEWIVIPDEYLNGVEKYHISESESDHYQILRDSEGNYLSVTQAYPSNDDVYEGTFEKAATVTFVNKITDITPAGSIIYKRMAIGSDEPGAGSQIVFSLQQYDGSTWTAAEGVAYLTFDEEGLTCDRVLYTDSDGNITLTKTDNGYPYIRFLNAEVFLNFYDYDTESVSTGTYRIIENTEETETEEWGILVGYGTADSAYTYSLDETEAVAFVNANRTAELKVEKVTDTESSQSFTFTLSHVLSTDKDGNILADEAGANISYSIYDAETNEQVSDGTTDALGQFTLTGGQYAVFELEDGAVWTVAETYDPTWTLSSLTAETDETISGWMAEAISANTAEVRTLAETAYAIVAETFYTEVDAGSSLSKDNFVVTAYSSDGTSRTLTSDEFEITPETAQDLAGEMEVTVTYNGAEDTVTITVEEEWNVSYAVAIYGIQEDTYLDEEGNEQTAGLTFGPATGASYVSSYKAHVTENAEGVVNSSNFKARTKDEAAADGVTYCIHWLTWDQIVEQSAKDPTVFEDCLVNGCTHAVRINLNSTLKNASYDYSTMTGDGASILYYSIISSYRQWNSSNTNSGGWPSSKIRTTLNDTSYGLFNCLPSVLQNNIVAKAVKSDTVYDSQTDTNNKTTYDKLWLFSGKEIYVKGTSGDSGIRTYEGDLYSRATLMNITTNSYSMNIGYNEDGSANYWWLRSPHTSNSYLVYYVTTSGIWPLNGAGGAGGSIIASYGLAPGFCLP